MGLGQKRFAEPRGFIQEDADQLGGGPQRTAEPRVQLSQPCDQRTLDGHYEELLSTQTWVQKSNRLSQAVPFWYPAIADITVPYPFIPGVLTGPWPAMAAVGRQRPVLHR